MCSYEENKQVKQNANNYSQVSYYDSGQRSIFCHVLSCLAVFVFIGILNREMINQK